ncbi:NmrA family NAD(P)-binding protein [Mesorhizobium sp. BR1-1-16]|uniref:NmrA family NAD(P)-binding protein n=1 Tax=Mesorhizobium sp. BR1-1-16 TaxID=2876653 RepID=UPI001CCD8217|nr:NmrA family NAD(P)-binding protein [Mesorhizobium sp. BR1-1-16]MBZ9936632.1 NmrA family NAD(P)-binding protein [Mesorhizobium sp. BR1-1-16]
MVETILVVGASGKFAGLVLPELAKRGAEIRAMIHHDGDEAAVRKAGAQDVVIGDLTDPASVDAALRDVHRVFYVPPVALPDEARVGKAFVDAAIAAGVRRFVFSSVIHPVLSALPNHALKAPVEDAVLNSSLEYTFLHPTVLFQNFAGAWDGIVTSGVVAEPWSNETRFSRVDYRDVAEVAAIALTEDRLLCGTFELCAEGWLNRHDVAALVGEVLGREIIPRRIDPRTLPGNAQALRPMFDHYDRIGLRDRRERRLDGRYSRHRRGRGDRTGSPRAGCDAARPRDLRPGRSRRTDR